MCSRVPGAAHWQQGQVVQPMGEASCLMSRACCPPSLKAQAPRSALDRRLQWGWQAHP